MLERIYILLAFHFLGDYVLQTDFLAKTKTTNYWHLIAHCVLYALPFCLYFGFSYKIIGIFVTHMVIDYLKARKDRISYLVDQILHIMVLAVFLYF